MDLISFQIRGLNFDQRWTECSSHFGSHLGQRGQNLDQNLTYFLINAGFNTNVFLRYLASSALGTVQLEWAALGGGPLWGYGPPWGMAPPSGMGHPVGGWATLGNVTPWGNEPLWTGGPLNGLCLFLSNVLC